LTELSHPILCNCDGGCQFARSIWLV
jgi:hypothetical protein